LEAGPSKTRPLPKFFTNQRTYFIAPPTTTKANGQ
jgi:hypothetical protein